MIDLKKYIKHAEECNRECDSYIKLKYSFKPNPNKDSRISIEETFYQNQINVGFCAKKNNHIIIPDSSASRFHGKIKGEDNELVYIDSSKKGTKVKKRDSIVDTLNPFSWSKYINDIFNQNHKIIKRYNLRYKTAIDLSAIERVVLLEAEDILRIGSFEIQVLDYS